MAATRKNWDEFRNAGLLWCANRVLHMFGWAIILMYDDSDRVVDAYPARVTYRGFPEDVESENFVKLHRYMSDNAYELWQEHEFEEKKEELDKPTAQP